MLVLSRKRGQKIIVTTREGDLIEIEFVDWNGNYGRIGITAPECITVDREEVHIDKIHNRSRKSIR